MAIHVSNGVTTITPTAWKCFTGAGVLGLIALVIPDHGWVWGLGAVFTAAFGSGKLVNIRLDRNGISSRHMFGTKSYAWDEITDFRLMKVKSGLFTAAKMVAFTKVSQQGSFYAKAAKFVSGGTQSLPAYGIKAKTLITLMMAYQAGVITSDNIIAKILGKTKFTKTPPVAPVSQASAQAGAAQFPNPASRQHSHSGRTQNGDMSAADRAMREAVAKQKMTGSTEAAKRSSSTSQKPATRFGKTPNAPPRQAKFGKARTQASPLVQDSGARRRRTGQ